MDIGFLSMLIKIVENTCLNLPVYNGGNVDHYASQSSQSSTHTEWLYYIGFQLTFLPEVTYSKLGTWTFPVAEKHGVVYYASCLRALQAQGKTARAYWLFNFSSSTGAVQESRLQPSKQVQPPNNYTIHAAKCNKADRDTHTHTHAHKLTHACTRQCKFKYDPNNPHWFWSYFEDAGVEMPCCKCQHFIFLLLYTSFSKHTDRLLIHSLHSVPVLLLF